MSTKKVQETGIIKKKFQLDWDSSDDEPNHHAQCFRSQNFPQNSIWLLKNKKIAITEEADEETDDGQDLSEIFNMPKKRVYRDIDLCMGHCDQNCPYRFKPGRRRPFWTIHDRRESISRSNRNREDPSLEEDSSSEYISEVYLDHCLKIELSAKNSFHREEYSEYIAPVPAFCEEVTMDDCNCIREAKIYVTGSDREELCAGKGFKQGHNGILESSYARVEKMVE